MRTKKNVRKIAKQVTIVIVNYCPTWLAKCVLLKNRFDYLSLFIYLLLRQLLAVAVYLLPDLTTVTTVPICYNF